MIYIGRNGGRFGFKKRFGYVTLTGLNLKTQEGLK